MTAEAAKGRPDGAGGDGFWTTSSSRVEAFSDAVFAIALTLLVLDLRTPATGSFSEQLLDEWQVYVAYLAAFLNIGVIWLNHHALFSRVRVVDPPTLLLNLGLLLGTSLVPWPTSLITAAVRSGNRDDQVAAIVVFAVMTVIVTVPWATVNAYLARRPELLRHASGATWIRRNARVSASSLAVAAAGAALAFLSPTAALLLFLLTPSVFLLLNLQNSARAHRRARA